MKRVADATAAAALGAGDGARPGSAASNKIPRTSSGTLRADSGASGAAPAVVVVVVDEEPSTEEAPAEGSSTAAAPVSAVDYGTPSVVPGPDHHDPQASRRRRILGTWPEWVLDPSWVDQIPVISREDAARSKSINLTRIMDHYFSICFRRSAIVVVMMVVAQWDRQCRNESKVDKI